MRRTFTILAAATVAVTAAAAPFAYQSATRPTKVTRQDMQPTQLTASQRSRAVGGIINGNAVLGDASSLSALNMQRPAKVRANADSDLPEIIRDQPEGKVERFVRSGYGYYSFYGMIFGTNQQGSVLSAVTTDDGTVYMKDLVSSAACDTWVKGKLENDVLTIPTGQYVDYTESEGYGLVLMAGKITEVNQNGSMSFTYECDSDVKEIKFTKTSNGGYKIEDKFCSKGDDASEYLVMLVWSDDYSWSGYGDYDSTYSPLTDTVIDFPDGLPFNDWVLKLKNPEDDTNAYRIVKVGITNDKIYIGGINTEAPENVIEGSLAAGKATFASDQYLGFNSDRVSYFTGGTYEVTLVKDETYGDYNDVSYAPAANLTFTYNAEAKTLTSVGADAAMILNSGKALGGSIYYIEAGGNPALSVFTEVVATPAVPKVTDFEDTFDDYGYIGMANYIPTEDVDGNFIDPAKMSYVIWFDVEGTKEKFVFYADEYPDIATLGLSELTEVPYNFESADMDGYQGIVAGGSIIYMFSQAPDAIGVQSIYTGGGERHESEIGWYSPSGIINKAEIGSQAVPVAVYGVDGVKRSSEVSGINIVRMSDGSVRKVIVRK